MEEAVKMVGHSVIENDRRVRILIVNADRIEKDTPTGLTLRSLFNRYDNKFYYQVYLNEIGVEKPSPKTMSMKCVFPVSLLLRSNHASAKNEENKARLRSEISSNSLGAKIRKRLRRGLIIAEDLGPMLRSKIHWQEIESFSPDIVYSIGASVRAMKLAFQCSLRFDIPIVLHFMDDWPNAHQEELWSLEKIYRSILNRWLNRCLSRSTGGLGISPFMASEYQLKYKIPFSWAGCVAERQFNNNSIKSISDRCKTMVYAGGLHLGRWKSLLEVEKAINEVAPEYHLEIYTSKSYREMYEKKFGSSTVFHEYVSRDTLSSVYASAACLIYVENADDVRYEAYCRLSISTKLPECLASGTPLLFYGPRSLGVYEMLEKEDIAATADNPQSLQTAILKVLRGEIDTLSAIKFTNDCFSGKANLKRMEDLFRTALARWK